MVSFTSRPLSNVEGAPAIHRAGGCVGLIVGLDNVEKRKTSFLDSPGVGSRYTDRAINYVTHKQNNKDNSHNASL
jgi:hypothetical protein